MSHYMDDLPDPESEDAEALCWVPLCYDPVVRDGACERHAETASQFFDTENDLDR